MHRLILILLILIASVWAGSELANHPGYVLLAYQRWVIELPLWLAFLGMLITFLLMHFVLHLLSFFRHLDQHWRGWREHRQRNKAYDKTHRGLLAIIEEHWSSAERHLLAGVGRAKNPVINYLSAAEAAYAQKAFDRCDAYLRKAYQVAPQDEVVIGLVQAKLELEQGQLEQALATLTHLRKLAPYHPAVLKLLEKMYIRLSDWQSLLDILPALQKAKVINPNQYLVFEKNIYCELLDEAEHKNQSIHAVRELWHGMPKKIRLHPDILERYTKLLKEDKNTAEEIEPLIRKLLNKAWNADLAKLYGSLQTGDPSHQLKIAEAWSKQYSKRSPLLLTLGRLSLRCHLWGKARYYLEEALKQDANSETQFELAKLFEQLGETQLALSHYKSGLALVTAS